MSILYVGCAGWSLPPAHARDFPNDGSHLARYAARFSAVEINSSFYRPHSFATYARWSASVPVAFRFSVKLPKTITHEQRLVGARKLLDAFFAEVAGLGKKLGCLLVQLPPSLTYKSRTARAFFTALRDRHEGPVVVEPRHATWFTQEATRTLQALRIARAAADPAVVPAAALPGASDDIVYLRLHGSPRMYFSSYSDDYLAALGVRLRALAQSKAPVWCIFDNTAYGVATGNGLALLRLLRNDLRSKR